MGDVKPWFMGEKPMCYYLVCLPPFLSHPTSSNLFIFLVEQLRQLWLLVVGGSYCFWEWGDRTVSPFPTRPLQPTTTFTPLFHDSIMSMVSWFLTFYYSSTHRGGSASSCRFTPNAGTRAARGRLSSLTRWSVCCWFISSCGAE